MCSKSCSTDADCAIPPNSNGFTPDNTCSHCTDNGITRTCVSGSTDVPAETLVAAGEKTVQGAEKAGEVVEKGVEDAGKAALDEVEKSPVGVLLSDIFGR